MPTVFFDKDIVSLSLYVYIYIYTKSIVCDKKMLYIKALYVIQEIKMTH